MYVDSEVYVAAPLSKLRRNFVTDTTYTVYSQVLMMAGLTMEGIVNGGVSNRRDY